MAKKEFIGDGQVKFGPPVAPALEDDPDDPKKEFRDRVRYLQGHIERGPRRQLLKPSSRGKNSLVRSLSYKQIAEVERDKILAGEDINPMFSGKESIMKRGKVVEKRLERLYETIKFWIKEKTYFSKNLLTEDDCAYISPGSENYLNRLIYTDFSVLEKRGRIYSRKSGQKHPKVFYLGKCPIDGDQIPSSEGKKKTVGAALGEFIKKKILVPGHVTIDVNINISFGK